MASALLPIVESLPDLGTAMAPLRQYLGDAYFLLGSIGDCCERRDRDAWERHYAAGMADFRHANNRAEQILGRDADYREVYLLRDRSRPLRCSDRAVIDAHDMADRLIGEAGTILDTLEKPLARGAWIGLFPLCAETVESARVDTRAERGPGVLVVWRPAYRQPFWRYSGRFNDDALSRRIAVRLHGAVIATPAIYEPLEGMLLSGPAEAALQQLAVEAGRAIG